MSLKAAVLSALVAWATGGSLVRAQDTTRAVRIGIRYTPGTKPGVIVLPISGPAGDSVRAILQRDMENSDRVNVVGQEALAAEPDTDGAAKPALNFPLYSRLGAAAVIQVTMTPAGVHLAIYDASTQKVAGVKDYPVTDAAQSPDWRMAMHAIADDIELQLTSVRGISATRLLYVSRGRLYRMDSDGANVKAMSADTTAMAPAWHPRGTHIAYVRVPDEGSQVVIQEIGGATRVVSGRPGTVNGSPTFSPDGATLVYMHGAENGTDLYAVGVFSSEAARKITVQRGMDATTPSFSPDGRKIVYTSNKTGHPELSTSDADGTNADALTAGSVGDQSYRSNPDWSPDGRFIAFQSQIEGRFQLYTINPRDRSMRQRTNEGTNEDPSWSPDGRHLLFTSNRSGTSQLWVLDIESGRLRQLTHAPAGAKYGAWSPLLKR